MAISISHAMPPVPVAQPNAVQASAKQVKPQPVAAPVDTVRISVAAQALQEVAEMPAQTAREANAGDIQAKHLLAKEAAEKAKA